MNGTDGENGEKGIRGSQGLPVSVMPHRLCTCMYLYNTHYIGAELCVQFNV